MKIKMDRYVIEDIPINVFYQDECLKRPIIFFVHGYFNDKEEGTSLARVLAHKGYFVVCLDAYMHGERLDPKLTEQNEEDYLYLMFEIVERTGKDINSLIEFFESDRRVDSNKIGLTGFSMGGFISFHVMSIQPKIKVAVPVIALPSFVEFWIDYLDEYKDKDVLAKIQLKDTPLFRNYLYNLDPFNHLTKFAPKPLLIINGKNDQHVPTIYSENLFELLVNRYKEYPQNLKLSIHECGHEVTTDMFNEIVDWFEKHLIPE